jgi:hypothetical protein
MNTDERIHAYCQNVDTVNNSDTQRLMGKSSQFIMNDCALNSNYYKQNQFSEEMKHSLIKLSTSYWFNLFECMKVVNSYCRTIFNLGINSMT